MNKLNKSGISNEELRKICIENGWFDNGTNSQYDKLFMANDQGASTYELSIMIWICTDDETSNEKGRPKIEEKLYIFSFDKNKPEK